MAAELIRGHLDLLVLSVVARGARHGYAIAEQLRLTSEGDFDIPEGTLYPALYRLEAGSLLTSEWTVVDGRRRRMYRLTRAGKRELARRTREWTSFADAVQRVVSKPARSQM
ncbi:MAG: PadR family transcriptional regulator [Actinobacteria bacterium]|nr:PadR family transcriptional regulator [Actinomycetota bacterium]